MLTSLDTTSVGALFVFAALVVAIAGCRITVVATLIAGRSGMGEAVTGAVFLGAATSLSGIVTSVAAAASGHPVLAYSNAVGGIAAQTAFLAIADMAYKQANLEHAAASIANLMHCALLITMLGLIMVGMSAPAVSIMGVHPISIVLPVAYGAGLWMVSQAETEPMWFPRKTAETRSETGDTDALTTSLRVLWIRFAALALPVAFAGWLIAGTGPILAARAGLSESAVGTLFTAVTTSFPELVTSIAAVRRGALTLAVSDIVGGNVFDTLFVSLSDIAYRDGSLLHAAGPMGQFITVVPVLMTGLLLMGLVRREKRGIAGIGFESFLILVVYACAAAILVTQP